MIPLAAIPGLIGRYWHFLLLGGVAVLLGAQTWRIASLKARHAEYVAGVEAERAKAAVRVIAIERAAARISQEKDASHAQAITDLRAAAARRLQGITGHPGAVPVVPHTPSFVDEAAGRDRLSIATADAVALMLAADENTAQLVALQGWVRAQIAAAR